jgi:hypothetical protein
MPSFPLQDYRVDWWVSSNSPGRLRRAAYLHHLAPAADPETVCGISLKVLKAIRCPNAAERRNQHGYERHNE